MSNKKYELTDAAHGVTFDIDNNGSGDHVSWTTSSIELKYHTEKKHDKFGNIFRYRAKVGSVKHSGVAKQAYDVILVVQ